MTLLRLNRLESMTKRRALAQVVPSHLWEHLEQVSPVRFADAPDNPETFRVIAPEERAEIHLRAPARRYEGDYAFSLDLEEAGPGQVEIGFIVINDLTSPRYWVDVFPSGDMTLLGTAGRNIEEEVRAMRAGLGPCQVRHGLRMFAELLPNIERLLTHLGYVNIVLEPLTYHNAVMYENYGFGYMTGYKRMLEIDRQFQPGGKLRARLDGSTPFRDPAFATSARGRSWAIHDGILEDYDGAEYLDLQMVKVIGKDANQRTFEP